MAIVKVWNDNVHEFKQEFKGEKFVIPAKQFIEMEYEEAIDFKGSFSPMPPPDYSGDESLFFKMIRVEAPPPNSIYKDESHTNHLTGQQFASSDELARALAQVRHLVVKDPDAERATPKNDEIAALKAQVAELAALVGAKETKKPGPKPKNLAKEA